MPLLKPKHQKLILQCYPSKKLSIHDTKPNNAELSYLIFYASTRRTKLEKVSLFLNKKTKSDISHGRFGHLKVTLFILLELIEKCSDDLGVLSNDIIDILTGMVSLKEIGTCQLSLAAFNKYAEKVSVNQKQIFSSSPALLNKFLHLANSFIDFGYSKDSNEDWKKLALESTEIVSKYIDAEFLITSNSKLIEKAITLILNNINKQPATNLSLIRTTTYTETKDLNELSINNIRLFFDTTDKKQLDLSTKALIKYSLHNKVELNWVNRLIEICTKKTHIELRYRIVSILIRELNNTDDLQLKEIMSELISNLLSSEDVNMVGLPVKEILNDVLLLQRDIVSIQNTDSSLSNSYIDIIRSLGKHIYYNNQINDMIEEILKNYYQICLSTLEIKSKQQFYELSSLFISDVESILQLSHDDTLINFKKAPYSINLFEYLFYTLDFRHLSYLTNEVKVKLQIEWFKVLERFFGIELDPTLTGRPNYDSSILNKTENPILLYLNVIHEITNNDTRLLDVQVWKVLQNQCHSLGINFFINYLNFTKYWSTSLDPFKYSVNLLILFECSTVLNIPELANLSYSKMLKLSESGKWCAELSVPPKGQISDFTNLNVDESPISSNELISILDNYPTISKWLEHTNLKQSSTGDSNDSASPLPASTGHESHNGNGLPVMVNRQPPKLIFTRSTTATNSILNGSTGSLIAPDSSSSYGVNRLNIYSLSNRTGANGTVRSIKSSSSIKSGSLSPGEGSVRAGNSAHSGGIGLRELLNSGGSRSIASSRMNSGGINLRELRNIASGGGNASGFNNGNTTPSSDRFENGNRQSETGVELLSPQSLSSAGNGSKYKKSGLAYCISGLNLSDEEEEPETEQDQDHDHDVSDANEVLNGESNVKLVSTV